MNNLYNTLKREFRIELRDPRALTVSAAFALTSSIAVGFASGGTPFEPKATATLYWLISYFCAMNSLAHIFIRERDDKTALFLKMTCTPQTVFISKLLFNIILLILLQTIITITFILFIALSVSNWPAFLLTALAGSFSLASTTTILAAMISRTRSRGTLFTIISLPITLPILWIAILATDAIIQGHESTIEQSIYFLLAFSFFITMVSFILFPGIWHDE